MNLCWTTPKRNIFKAVGDLRRALSSGRRAKLVRARNKDCEFPIKTRNDSRDFRDFEFQVGYASCRDTINARTDLSDFEKHLALNYHTCYGTPEAREHYYKTGQLQPDNDKGVGTSHLVLVQDFVDFLDGEGQHSRANMFRRQYLTPGYDSICHLYQFFRLKRDIDYWNIPDLKVWAIATPDADETVKTGPLLSILNFVLKPLKWIPEKDVLDMGDYKNVTYRVGSVMNGFAVEFHVPKKFSFQS